MTPRHPDRDALVLVACVGFWLWPRSAMHLVGISVVLGFGHMFCMAGHQMLMVRAGGPHSRENVLGYYMIAAAIGQGLGPFLAAGLAAMRRCRRPESVRHRPWASRR